MKMNSWIKWMILVGRNDLFWVMAQEAKKSGGGVCFTDWRDHLSVTFGIHLFRYLFILFFFLPTLDFIE